MSDGLKSHAPKAVTLHRVVYNIAQAIEGLGAVGQHFLGLAYGACYAEAEATALVNLDGHGFIRRPLGCIRL